MKYKQKLSVVVLLSFVAMFLLFTIGNVSVYASAQSVPSESIYVYPGEVISNILYISLCNGADSTVDISGTATASGSAASWATPQTLNFENVAPGECSTMYYTVSVPMSVQAGQSYDLSWSGTICNGVCSPPVLIVVYSFVVTPQFPFGSIVAIIAPLSALGIYLGTKNSIWAKKLVADSSKTF